MEAFWWATGAPERSTGLRAERTTAVSAGPRRRRMCARLRAPCARGGQGEDAERGLAACRVAWAVPIPRRPREADHRPGSARADPVARDPSGVDGRLDLAGPEGEAAGG